MTSAILDVPVSLIETEFGSISVQKLERLAADAQTAAEHQRIAQYYEAKAQDYLAQAQAHKAMRTHVAFGHTDDREVYISASAQSQYFVTNYLALAAKSERLAELHRKLAIN